MNDENTHCGTHPLGVNPKEGPYDQGWGPLPIVANNFLFSRKFKFQRRLRFWQEIGDLGEKQGDHTKEGKKKKE